VVKEAIEDGGCNGAIAVEDSRPLFEGFVGGDDDGIAFVSLADDLESIRLTNCTATSFDGFDDLVV
jgi:hypothetical protein